MTISATTQGIKPGVCTSTNRPSAPFDGQVIYMTDVDQTAVWDGAQWTVLAPIAGGRNVLINGDFKVWQRSTDITIVSTYGYVSADRWTSRTASASGSMRTSRQSSGLTGFQYCARAQRTSGNTIAGGIQLIHTLETINSLPLAGKTVTLSFYARKGSDYSPTGSTLGTYLYSGTGTDQSWLSFTGLSTLISQSPVLTTTWQRFSYSATVASGATQLYLMLNMEATGTAGANDYFEVTGVQLEAGAVATPFEFEDYGTTLQKCQRYYETSYNGVAKGTSTAAGVVYASSSTDQYGSYILPSPLWLIPKRTTPSVTTYSQAGTINKWNYYRSGVSDQEINVNLSSGYNSPRSTLLYISTGVAFVSATGYGHFVADAEL